MKFIKNRIPHQNYDRSWIDIDLDKLIQNLTSIKKLLLPHQEILQVVKADGYGHGALQIAKTVLQNGVSMLGVANVEEASYLRYHNIEAPILILSPILTNEAEQVIKQNIIPCINNLELCERLNLYASKLKKKIVVHLKINTGMNRNGINHQEFAIFLQNFHNYQYLEIEGLFTHFAASDDDELFSNQQYQSFVDCINLFRTNRFQKINGSLKYLHISNSTGFLNFNTAEMNLIRLGLISYGYLICPKQNNRQRKINISPIMSFKSRIAHLGVANPHDTIGYNRSYIVEKKLKYAVIPVGYADGYDFLLSNRAEVMIANQPCKLLGRVSMDLICVDVTNIEHITLSEEVCLLGDESSPVSALSLSEKYHGSVYELLCQIGRRAKRYYFFKGKLIEDEPLQRRAFVPADFNTEKLNTIIQQAIQERMQDNEISKVLYQDLLKYIFVDYDNNGHFREDFQYEISFFNSTEQGFYKVKTTLTYQKVFTNKKFFIVCANNKEKLQKFFQNPLCEYRWLVDKQIKLTKERMLITKIALDKYNLGYTTKFCHSCIIYEVQDPAIKKMKGKKVQLFLETETFYPLDSSQLSVMINEITKGVTINFHYPNNTLLVEPTLIFSGSERFPLIMKGSKKIGNTKYKTITIQTHKDTWVYPSSGVIFSLKANNSHSRL